MRKLPIDGAKLMFVSTGKVRPVRQYAELADGSRRLVPESQEVNDAGLPLWQVDVMPEDDDSDRSEVVAVKVASKDEPKLPKFGRVQFTDLMATIYQDRATKRPMTSFTATGVVMPKAQG